MPFYLRLPDYLGLIQLAFYHRSDELCRERHLETQSAKWRLETIPTIGCQEPCLLDRRILRPSASQTRRPVVLCGDGGRRNHLQYGSKQLQLRRATQHVGIYSDYQWPRIINNSGVTQSFSAEMGEFSSEGINFTGSATVGSWTSFTIRGGV